MSKFKVGDEVRITYGDSFQAVIGKIARNLHGDVYAVSIKGVDYAYNASDFELVKGAVQEDPTNPSHYKAFGAEVIEITEHLSFNRGNCIKYAARAGLKNADTEIEDLEKARWYIEREIALVKKRPDANA